MLYIINGLNFFSKESTISSITSKLEDDCNIKYNIKNIKISSTTKNEEIQNMLDYLVINLSTDGLFSFGFCGVVSLPELPKKKKTSKSNKNSNANSNLFDSLVDLASMYCSEEKQLIIYTPTILSNSDKKEISNICKNIHVKFIDLTYISKYSDIYKFCSKTLDDYNINFASSEDKENFISHICSISECTQNKKGKLEEITIFTKPSDIVYNQQLIYTSIVSLALWSFNTKESIAFEDAKRILLTAHPKQYIYSLIERITKCSTKKEVAKTINSIFDHLSKQEILAVLTILKLCMWDYVKFINGGSKTKNCKIIANGNLKFSDPLKLYHKIHKLRENTTLHVNSYKNDLILFLWEHLENENNKKNN